MHVHVCQLILGANSYMYSRQVWSIIDYPNMYTCSRWNLHLTDLVSDYNKLKQIFILYNLYKQYTFFDGYECCKHCGEKNNLRQRFLCDDVVRYYIGFRSNATFQFTFCPMFLICVYVNSMYCISICISSKKITSRQKENLDIFFLSKMRTQSINTQNLTFPGFK